MIKKIISGILIATSLTLFTPGCDVNTNPPHRASQYLSQKDQKNIEEVISQYHDISKIGKDTFTSEDDVLYKHRDVVTILSEVYGREKTLGNYFKLRKEVKNSDHIGVLLVSALQNDYDAVLNAYLNLKESRRISNDHKPALISTVIKYGLGETEKAYDTIKELRGISFDDRAIITKAALEHSLEEAMSMYKKIRDSNVPHQHRGVLTKLALKQGLERALETYKAVRDYGKDTFSSNDNIPFDHQGILTNIALEFGLEKALGMYDRLRIEGKDTFTSEDDIPSDHRPLLAANGCIKDLEDNKAVMQKIINDDADDMLVTFLVVYYLLFVMPSITGN